MKTILRNSESLSNRWEEIIPLYLGTFGVFRQLSTITKSEYLWAGTFLHCYCHYRKSRYL